MNAAESLPGPDLRTGRATDKVDALYGQPPVLPADAIGPGMARLRREHHRLLGNGYCTRPPSWTARSSRSAKPARFS
jgi:hypothetical protein